MFGLKIIRESEFKEIMDKISTYTEKSVHNEHEISLIKRDTDKLIKKVTELEARLEEMSTRKKDSAILITDVAEKPLKEKKPRKVVRKHKTEKQNETKNEEV